MAEPFNVETALAFTQDKQAAIFGWCLQDSEFCHQCAHAVKAEWFSSTRVAQLYKGLQQLVTVYGRVPTPLELRHHETFRHVDAAGQKALTEALEHALKQTKYYSLALLRAEMTHWMHAVIFAQAMEKASVVYNAGAKAEGAAGFQKVEEAWQIVESAFITRSTATFEDGVNQGFVSSEERMRREREDRLADAGRVLSYGVRFLDDTLSAIMPSDLVVIGAKTGAGKTQLATSVALETSQSAVNYVLAPDGRPARDAEGALVPKVDEHGVPVLGAPVHYFALEAEDNEIERRIKFGKISGLWYQLMDERQPVPAGLRRPPANCLPLSYPDWRASKHGFDRLLKPYEEYVEKDLLGAVRNLNTLYRTSGHFSLDTLERTLLQVVRKSRLIVIDHLHYVDVEDSDENKGYKQVIKTVRDVVLHYRVPVIVIAHLRKTQGGARSAPLISSVEDFHGTSDVPKIATTCIMMGPAYDQEMPEPHLWPTYMGAVKSRLDGSRTRFTGLVHYNARTSRYEQAYRLGKLANLGQEWDELEDGKLPGWARVGGAVTTGHTIG